MPASPLRRFYSTFRLVVLVPLARLRFLFILGAIGFLIVKWDDLLAQYEKRVPAADDDHAADPDHEFYCPMHPTVVRDNNKQKCPICFMPLSKRKKGETTDEPLPAGVVSRVQCSPASAPCPSATKHSRATSSPSARSSSTSGRCA
jgi:membrane fusion protein, copper/silver efflux system